MDLKLLATLKKKMQEAKEFKEVWAYFLDHFGEDPKFISLGEAFRSEFLEAIIAQVAAQVIGKDAKVVESRLIRLPDQGFIHGGTKVGQAVVNVLFFEDAGMGMMCILKPAEGPNLHFVRFRGQIMVPPRSSTPSNN